jgi:hypothetical protein
MCFAVYRLAVYPERSEGSLEAQRLSSEIVAAPPMMLCFAQHKLGDKTR